MALWDRLHITKTAHASKARDTVGSSTKQAAGVQKPDKAKQDKTPPRKMAELADSQDFCTRVVETYEQHAKTRRTTLVFCATVDMVIGMTKRFNDAGIKAREVTGSTPHAVRDARIASFAAGDFPVLVNCQLLTQGINIPAVSLPSRINASFDASDHV
jgi:ATP-dependent helicase IRC3